MGCSKVRADKKPLTFRDLIDIVELLLNHNAKLLLTNGGEDALHWWVEVIQNNSYFPRASRNGSLKSIGMLLNFYADINVYVKNEKGETAIDLASSSQIREMLEGLEEVLSS